MSGIRLRSSPADAGGPLFHQRVWEIAIALVAAALYARTVGFGWVYDDQVEIVLNPFIRSLGNLPRILSTTVWAGSGMETYLYRPLALVSYSLNHVVSGLAPWSFHLTNVVLHAGASVLVFRLGRLWGMAVAAAGIGGLVFAVHPVHVEVVAAVFGRKDLLAAFFVLAFLLLHHSANLRGGWRLVLPVVAYSCAMLSKEVGVVGIVLVGIQDWLLTEDRTRLSRDRRRANLYVAYMVSLLVYVLIRNWVTGGVGIPDTFYMDNPLVAGSLLVRVGTAVAVLGKGLLLQLAPLTLSPDYSFDAIPLVESPTDWRLLGMAAFFAFAGWGGWRLRQAGLSGHREPESGPGLQPSERSGTVSVVLWMAAAWYAVTVLPTANLLVTVGTIFGERLLYLPSVGFCLAAGVAVHRLVKGRTAPGGPVEGSRRGLPLLRSIGVLGVSAWVTALCVQTTFYSSAWANDIALFRHAVEAVPNSTKANHKLGEELLRAGRTGAALPYLRRALEIAPDNEFAARTLAVAHQELARLYLPSTPGATPLAEPPVDPEVLHLLGRISRERGDLNGAGRFWEAAVAADPSHTLSQGDLGILRLAQGDTSAALRHLHAAVSVDPTLAGPWLTLGRIHLAQGNTGPAREALETFIRATGNDLGEQVRWARGAISTLPRD